MAHSPCRNQSSATRSGEMGDSCLDAAARESRDFLKGPGYQPSLAIFRLPELSSEISSEKSARHLLPNEVLTFRLRFPILSKNWSEITEAVEERKKKMTKNAECE